MPTGPLASPAVFWLLVAAGAAGAGLTAVLVWWLSRRHDALASRWHDERETARHLADLSGGCVWRSDAAHRLIDIRGRTGGPGHEILSRALGSPVADVLRATAGPALSEVFASQASIECLAVRCGAADDAPGGVLSARPLHDAQGRFAGYLGVLRPAEASAADEDGAAEAMRAEVESFSYTVSHDLRAPLRVVEGFSRILKEDYGRQLDRIGHDHLDRVMAAAARMNGMIDALLALTKLSTQPLVRRDVDLSQLAGWVVDELRRQWPERHVQVHIDPGLRAHGDPTLLRLVLENLLGNAWKYSGRRADAQIGFVRDADGVYTVSDNGAGFDMRYADRLFGVFQRLHSASDFVGTGVGLASVRRIVRRHGGDVWAEAEVGQGARFHFTLPSGR